MRLLTCTGAPSPRRVTLYLAEKGIELDMAEVDLKSGEHLSDAFQAMSPECTVPVLELADGTCLWNSIAIRQYLESLHPEPGLLGGDALARALVTQYVLWIEHNGMMSVADIDALVMIDFGRRVTKAELDANANLSKWYERVRNRPAIRAEG